MTLRGIGGGWAADVHGNGRVGKALCRLLPRAGVKIASLHDRSGVRYQKDCRGRTRVFVDVTSPVYEGSAAEEWVRFLEGRLLTGTPVVTCNKAPLATAWSRLERAAREGHTSVSCNGTVGGGTPVLPFLLRLHQTQGLQRVEGTLNATLGFVCARVSAGDSVESAVRMAQRSGWAEPDPSLDLDGTDARAKAIIIHNLLFRAQPPIALNRSRPRLRLDPGELRRAARAGRSSNVVARVEPGKVALAVRSFETPETVAGNPAVASVRAILRDGSEAVLRGPGAGARAAAGALLGDILALSELRELSAPGVTA